jgi:hypothetical protein
VIDGEKLIRDYLEQHPAVAALSVEIVGKTPKDTDEAWVRVTQFDAPRVVHGRNLIAFYFQLDCYASKRGISGSQQAEAAQIAGAIFDALAELDGANYQADGATVTGCDPNMGPRLPDSDLTPARERYASTATVWAHG